MSPARMILCQVGSIHIRYSLLGIHGQHHHMLSVRRLMTTAGKFSGLANVVRKLLQQIDKQWHSSWITIVPDGCTGWFRITSVHWEIETYYICSCLYTLLCNRPTSYICYNRHCSNDQSSVTKTSSILTNFTYIISH